mmetsp:Transcript_14316/g.33898  ORF Transcript_14316/g.33898 Transcript_14316/m.33898 type:complete len:273 (-) Transcript_14316:868-1686(-)
MGRRQVVEEPRRLVGVRRTDANVEDPPGPLIGLLEGEVPDEALEAVLQDADVLQRALGDEVGKQLPRGVVVEEGEVQRAHVVKEVPKLLVGTGRNEAADDGADARARQDPGQEAVLQEGLHRPQVEGAEGAAAAEHEGRPPKRVPCLSQEGELLVWLEVRPVVAGDGLEALRDLVDVPSDGRRHHRAVLVEPAVGHVAEVAQEVRPERKHHLMHVPVGADLLQLPTVLLEEPRIVEAELLSARLLELAAGHHRPLELVKAGRRLGPLFVRGR